MKYEMLGYVSYHTGVSVKDIDEVLIWANRYNKKKDKQKANDIANALEGHGEQVDMKMYATVEEVANSFRNELKGCHEQMASILDGKN